MCHFVCILCTLSSCSSSDQDCSILNKDIKCLVPLCVVAEWFMPSVNNEVKREVPPAPEIVSCSFSVAGIKVLSLHGISLAQILEEKHLFFIPSQFQGVFFIQEFLFYLVILKVYDYVPYEFQR